MTDNAALLAVVCFVILAAAYSTYGRFLARRVFQLDALRSTPAHTRQDGIDFVPTRAPILFGHHFASIAGLGPILGPAIAVIWGWVPALLWVVLGSILIGAVHDMGALTVSIRFQGRTIGDVCRDLIGPRARILALLIIFFMMSLAMGAFVISISNLFVRFNPDAIIPSAGLMLVAMCFGVALYKLRIPLLPATVVALLCFAGLILLGEKQPLLSYSWFVSPQTRQAIDAAKQRSDSPSQLVLKSPYGAAAALEYFRAQDNQPVAEEIAQAAEKAAYWWVALLLGYAFVASVLPVWLLLQPRDYINSFQLYFALSTLLGGLLLAAARGAPENHINAPMFRPDVPGAPSWVPFLFVTIACGAVSGFHSLVSSGTTARQISRETDALPIGYGAMLVEAALAVLVILACAAGLGAEAWSQQGTYASWEGIGKATLAAQLSAVVRGGANFLSHLGIPNDIGSTLLAVTVVAFALTTLDSATRLLRFNIEEILRSAKLDMVANRYVASAIAVAAIAFFALVPAGKTLWTMFGTVNQLLAGLALLTVSIFLYKLGRPIRYTIVPMALMLLISIWAMLLNLYGLWTDTQSKLVLRDKWALSIVTVVILGMALWLVAEAVASFARRLDAETFR